MNRRGLRAIDLYVAVVSIAGIGVLVALVAAGGLREIGRAPGPFWALGVLAVVGELFPIRLPRRDDSEEITTSTPFGFALMLGWGTGPAAVVLAAASVTSDVGRKPLWKVMFNMSAYVCSIGAAGGVFALLRGTPMITGVDAGPIVAAALTFFVVNTATVEIAVALSQDLAPLYHLRRNLAFQAVTAGILLCLAPIMVVLAQRSLFLLPLLAFPLASVHWGARTSVENTHLAEQNQLKDDLIAVVSHELRTPLTSIQGYVKSLLQIGESLEPEQRQEFLEGAARQSDRLRRLVEELLVVARLDAQVESLDVYPVDVPALGRQVVDELRDVGANHHLELAFDPGLPTLSTDEAKLHRILSNLIENALKYSPAGTTVRVRTRAGDDGLVLSVEDEGTGIPAAARDRIFERFYQVERARTGGAAGPGGTGLGLYICRRLTETLGGRLELERSGAGGSVFSLTLPWSPPGPRRRLRRGEHEGPVVSSSRAKPRPGM